MKVLLYTHLPSALAHGGMQIQIDQTKAALERIGVEVEYLRWWDDSQPADIIHFFGRMPVGLIRFAQPKGIRVVQSDLLGGQGSRPTWLRRLHRLMVGGGLRFLPRYLTEVHAWHSYQLADACVALTLWEAQIMREVFHAPASRIHVVPNGVEQVFLDSQPVTRGPWVICTATITTRKRVLELAEAALRAEVPLWVIGKPYDTTDPYAEQFLQLTRKRPEQLRYDGAIADRARLARVYREARGFVLLSAMESLSLSALEATACRCPLLLSDLPWARCTFGDKASYCPVTRRTAVTAHHLRQFYDDAERLPPPPPPKTWQEVAEQLRAIYVSLL